MNEKYPLTQQEFEQIYAKVPRLNVEVIIKSDKGVLLTKRSIPPFMGTWHIPGGTVYMQESLEDAVSRVAMNELSVKVNIIKLLGHITYPDMYEASFGWPVGIAFLCEINGDNIPQPSEQGEEIAWYKELPVNTFPHQAKAINTFGIV